MNDNIDDKYVLCDGCERLVNELVELVSCFLVYGPVCEHCNYYLSAWYASGRQNCIEHNLNKEHLATVVMNLERKGKAKWAKKKENNATR